VLAFAVLVEAFDGGELDEAPPLAAAFEHGDDLDRLSD
jgi:hypothetical protein